LWLLEPASGAGFDSELMEAIAAFPWPSEVVRDEKALDELLWALEGSGQCAVILCAPRSDAGMAREVLYRVRAAGANAAFVAYGDFSKDALVQLLRLAADDVILQGGKEEIGAVLEQAARRVGARRRHEENQRTAMRRAATLRALLAESEKRLEAAQRVAVESLLMALAVREPDAIEHSFRVQAYARHLAEIAGYPEQMREVLGRAALLHDIGKIGVSDEVLFRKGWLKQDELLQLEPHAEFGAVIAERAGFLRALAPIVRHHHERFDGQGFPEGLAGRAIPLGARIFAIADSLDAMTSDKTYRAAMTFEVAAEEIHRNAGKQFDPKLVEHFLSVAPSTWQTIRDEVMGSLRRRDSLFLFPATAEVAQHA
jgi:putative nucleotidyltransferase with HDIG domain